VRNGPVLNAIAMSQEARACGYCGNCSDSNVNDPTPDLTSSNRP
jgi:hypothetical protein